MSFPTKRQVEILRADLPLSHDQLDDKYNPEGGGEHPVFTRQDWRQAVANEDTISGYWVWAEGRIYQVCDDLEDGTLDEPLS